jgi:hypothetical protein
MSSISVLTTSNSSNFIVSEFSYNPTPPRPDFNPLIIQDNPSRSLSQLGTESYIRSLRRAFTRAKHLAFFNPDLTKFVTLTYAQNMTDPEQALTDIKIMIKSQNRANARNLKNLGTKPPTEFSPFPQGYIKIDAAGVQYPLTINKNDHSSNPCGKGVNSDHKLKYIYVLELQKRGAVHVHMITTEKISTHLNKNGYFSVDYWNHGFSSVLDIDKTDGSFKPYLYLFKYMTKAQRVGGSFIHTSRNFDKIQHMDYNDFISNLSEPLEVVHDEISTQELKEGASRPLTITRQYFRKKNSAN